MINVMEPYNVKLAVIIHIFQSSFVPSLKLGKFIRVSVCLPAPACPLACLTSCSADTYHLASPVQRHQTLI